MMTMDTIVMLAKYSDWADQTLFKAMQSLPEGAPYRKSETLFGSMVGTLNHNYQVDLIWQAHLLGKAHGFTSRRDILHPELHTLIEEQSIVNRWYIDWAKEQTSQSLGEKLKFSFVTGEPGEMTRGGMFLHIVNHKTFHRGWISQMFFDVRVKPPETDLCVFLCNVENDACQMN